MGTASRNRKITRRPARSAPDSIRGRKRTLPGRKLLPFLVAASGCRLAGPNQVMLYYSPTRQKSGARRKQPMRDYPETLEEALPVSGTDQAILDLTLGGFCHDS